MYKDDFQYIGAFVEEREKLIEDGVDFADSDNITENEAQQKFEQSDLVIVLLNIACVPDSVVKQIKDFKAGW